MELSKLDKAIIYVEALAEGINPVNNTKIANDSIYNDVNIVRCMYFIKEVLEEVKKNGGIGKASKPFPFEVLKDFTYQGDKTISKICKQLNELVNDTEVQKLKFMPIINWLTENGYIIKQEMAGFDNLVTIVTLKGEDIGMYNEVRLLTSGRKYLAVVYDKRAQKFLVENLKEIFNQSNDMTT